jgi:hypothetical protein
MKTKKNNANDMTAAVSQDFSEVEAEREHNALFEVGFLKNLAVWKSLRHGPPPGASRRLSSRLSIAARLANALNISLDELASGAA